jgi:hypothetical protein
MIGGQCASSLSQHGRQCLACGLFSTVQLSGGTGRARVLRRIARSITLAGLGAVSILCIACSSHREAAQVGQQATHSSEAANKSGHVKVCSLLSVQEVSAATKRDIVNATSDDDNELCNYTTEDDSAPVVGVQVGWEGGKFALQAGSKLMESAAGGAQFRTPVGGIGDEAFVLGVSAQQQNQIDHAMPEQLKGLSSLTTGPLMFRKKDVMVTVTANFIDNKFKAEKEMAAKIAGRL